MRLFPRLTSERDFAIEAVMRTSDSEFSFRVILKLANGGRNDINVKFDVLFDFVAFRAAALIAANVFLRHEAEEGTLEGRRAWLDVIERATNRVSEVEP